MATIRRSILKTVTFRVTNVIAAFGLILLLTGNIALGLTIVAADAILSSIMYFTHERIWDRIKWGSKNVNEK